MNQFGIGQPVRRVEDRRFLTGRGSYVDDLVRPRQAYAYMLRSPHAHARIRALDTAAAAAAPGVLAVLTGEDVARDGLGPIPCLSAADQPRRLDGANAAASGDGPRPGAACRRYGGDGGGGKPRRRARRGRADRGRLRDPAGRGRDRACARSGPAAGVGRGAGQSRLRLGSRRQRGGRAGDGGGAPPDRRSSWSTTASSSIRWSRAARSANTMPARMPIPCGARPRARIFCATCWPKASSRSRKTASAS